MEVDQNMAVTIHCLETKLEGKRVSKTTQRVSPPLCLVDLATCTVDQDWCASQKCTCINVSAVIAREDLLHASRHGKQRIGITG